MEAPKCKHCGLGLHELRGRLKFGRLDNGRVYACPTCDSPDKPPPGWDRYPTIIELSERNLS